ncbi:phosphodiester glycosidase family protein [Erythrobacter crassostreae]|uniref:Phosphodiester glycosidase family protein n=1 Tax=Erythrobacter crassostreae TaxID=2828328 RepID=A0A9X1JP15_9SPHN|nr:phosphodiester glycosidase family protein [Erythrobacter crassostrea]MBV7260243.1 phosphodiester glycosidase family protein [Erythrobacter crassostrea]
MKRIFLITVLTALVSCEQQPEGEPVVRTQLDGSAPVEIVETPQPEPTPTQTSENSVCSAVTFEGVALTHCVADPSKHSIETALAPASGDGFGTIKAWAAGKNEGEIAFVTNGGMYGDNLRAIGYFVRNSDRLKELNREDGPGNFHLKPNGVFFGSNGKWQVLDTETFYRTIGDRPQFGTQSGPMLVVRGKLHPEFQDDGPSRAIRNGVGVTSDGKAHFVISDAPISFGRFGRFFRDELKTPNAVFLDGNVSSLWDPATGRMDSRRVGPLLVVKDK